MRRGDENEDATKIFEFRNFFTFIFLSLMRLLMEHIILSVVELIDKSFLKCVSG